MLKHPKAVNMIKVCNLHRVTVKQIDLLVDHIGGCQIGSSFRQK